VLILLTFELVVALLQAIQVIAQVHPLGSVTIGLVTSIRQLLAELVLGLLRAFLNAAHERAVVHETRLVEVRAVLATDVAAGSVQYAPVEWVESPLTFRTRGSCGVFRSTSTRARRPRASSSRRTVRGPSSIQIPLIRVFVHVVIVVWVVAHLPGVTG
jgi:hypothetical protein